MGRWEERGGGDENAWSLYPEYASWWRHVKEMAGKDAPIWAWNPGCERGLWNPRISLICVLYCELYTCSKGLERRDWPDLTDQEQFDQKLEETSCVSETKSVQAFSPPDSKILLDLSHSHMTAYWNAALSHWLRESMNQNACGKTADRFCSTGEITQNIMSEERKEE